jgi:hypothetical protein
MEVMLKGRSFYTAEEIYAEKKNVLNILTKKHFQDAFQKGQKLWDRRVLSQGEYFKGDSAEYDPCKT